MAEGRSSVDDIIDLYKQDVDVSLIRENLKLTPDERLSNMVNCANFALQAQDAGKRLREKDSITSLANDNNEAV